MPEPEEGRQALNRQRSRNPHLSLWRNRDYLLLWSGQGISTLGSGVTQLAMPLLVLALSHSAAQAGIVNALIMAPFIVFGLVAGALVDRWDRKRLMILCDAVRAPNIASIPLAGALARVTLGQLYIVALVEGTSYALFSLAEAAALPQVVTEEQLTAAVAQNRIMYDVTNLLGPPLGGTLFAVGRTLPFLADMVSYTVSVFSLLAIHTHFQQERTPHMDGLRTEIVTGLRFLWNTPVLRFMAFINSGISFTLYGVPLMAIVLAKGHHASPAQIGLMFSAGGVGGITGALAVTRVRQRLSFGAVIIGILWIWSVLLSLLAIAPNVVTIGALLMLVLFVDPTYDIVQYSYRLSLIPDELQGRVNSAFRLIAWGMRPIGIALAGFLLQFAGATRAVLFFGVCLVLIALAALLNPYIRNAPPMGTQVEALT